MSPASASSKEGILLAGYGAPERLEQVPAFLESILGGRPLNSIMLSRLQDKYDQIGGGSPLLSIVRDILSDLRTKHGIPADMGMHHSPPSMSDALQGKILSRCDHTTVIALTPHYSRLSVGKYARALDHAVKNVEYTGSVRFVPDWHDHPIFISALARRVIDTLERYPEAERDGAQILFTAHSLPEKVIQSGDPYAAQVEQTAHLIASELGIPADRWSIAYQSASRGGGRWLGPDVTIEVERLASDEVERVVICPLSFLCDNMEVLYDLDIELTSQARRLGLQLQRVPLMNNSPETLELLISLARASQPGGTAERDHQDLKGHPHA